MVALYVGGQKVEWADAERVLSGRDPGTGRVELRTDAGAVLGLLVPEPPAGDPDWVKAITPEAIERRTAGEFLTFEELKQRMGWQ